MIQELWFTIEKLRHILTLVNWPMVSALAASLGLIVALYFHTLNLANTRLSNSAKMVSDLVKEFNSIKMRQDRKVFAKKLLDKKERNDINLRKDNPVLEFFEEIGYMTRRKVLDKGMVWNSFSWCLEYYYLAVTQEPNLIKKARLKSDLTPTTKEDAPCLFREVEFLYNQMLKISKKEEGKMSILATDKDLEDFLMDELALDTKDELKLNNPTGWKTHISDY